MYSHLCIVLSFIIALCLLARPFIIPLAFSFLFALLLNPFLRRLENWGMRRIFAIIIILLAFVILLGSFLYFLGFQASMLMQDLPSIQDRILELAESTLSDIRARFGLNYPDKEQMFSDALGRVAPFFGNLVSTTSSLATVLVQIPVYVFLIMLYKDRFRRFLISVTHNSAEGAQGRIDEVKSVVQGYVTGLFVVIGILTVLNSLGLWALGIRYAWFFGVFSAVLTVIPYLGNFIGGALPFIVALVTKDSMWYAVGVVALYTVIQFIEGNFITPNIMGSRVSVNPLAALISMIIGAQLLGLAGIILAIPILGILKVTFAHSNTLKPLVILLEDRS